MPSDDVLIWADLDDSGAIDPDERAFAIGLMRLPFIGPVIGRAFITVRWLWWAAATAGHLLTINRLLTPADGPVTPADGPVTPADGPVTPADGPVAPADGPVAVRSKLAAFSTFVMLTLVADVIAPAAADPGSKISFGVQAAQLLLAGLCVTNNPNRGVLLSAATLCAVLLRGLWWPLLQETVTDLMESNVALVTAQSHSTHGWADLDNDGTTSTAERVWAQGVLANVHSLPVIGHLVGNFADEIVGMIRWLIWLSGTWIAICVGCICADPQYFAGRAQSDVGVLDVRRNPMHRLVLLLCVIAADCVTACPASADPGEMVSDTVYTIRLLSSAYVFLRLPEAERTWQAVAATAALWIYLLTSVGSYFAVASVAWHQWSYVADDLHREDGQATSASFAACLMIIGGFGWRVYNGPIGSNANEESATVQLVKITFMSGLVATVIELFFPAFCDYPFVFDPLCANELARILGSPALVAAGLLGVKRGLEPDRIARSSSLTEEATAGLLDCVTAGVTEEVLFRFALQPVLMVAIYGIIGLLPVVAVLFEEQSAAYTMLTFGLIDGAIAEAANGSVVYIYATHSADVWYTLGYPYPGRRDAGLLFRAVVCLCGRSWLYRFGLLGAIVGHVGFELCVTVLPPIIARLFTRQNPNKVKSE